MDKLNLLGVRNENFDIEEWAAEQGRKAKNDQKPKSLRSRYLDCPEASDSIDTEEKIYYQSSDSDDSDGQHISTRAAEMKRHSKRRQFNKKKPMVDKNRDQNKKSKRDRKSDRSKDKKKAERKKDRSKRRESESERYYRKLNARLSQFTELLEMADKSSESASAKSDAISGEKFADF